MLSRTDLACLRKYFKGRGLGNSLRSSEISSRARLLRAKRVIQVRSVSLTYVINGKSPKEVILTDFKWNLVERIGPEWADFSGKICLETSETLEKLNALKNGLVFLDKEINSELAESGLKGKEHEALRSELVHCTKAILFRSIPVELAKGLRQLYLSVFKAFVIFNNGATSMEECCEGCGRSQDACCCEIISKKFREIMITMESLDLIDRLVSKEAVDIAYKTVQDQVKRTVSGSFAESYLNQLLEVLGWLQEVYAPLDKKAKSEICAQEIDRLTHFLYESYSGCLVDSMFDIVADWPESTPALMDLKKCFDLVPSNLKRSVAESMKKSVAARLLHPGVNTSVILTAYMQAVNSLRLLDPSGVIMDEVCHSIRQYLRQRPDTVRCIVSFLTEKNNLAGGGLGGGEGGSMRGDDSLLMDVSELDTPHESDHPSSWQDWMPDPVEVSQGGRRGHRKADMMSMLVSVYGSKELFVKEYCQLLSERLLKNVTFEADTEKRYLEMLKARFGETELNQCEVMLKDMKDSDRINADIKETALISDEFWSKDFPVTAKILSAQFWPAVKEERIRLPEEAQDALEKYKMGFEKKKGFARTIEWWGNAGSVEIELEMNQHRVQLVVSPVQAAIIHKFQAKETWTFDDLCGELQTTHGTLKRRLSWWSSLGILLECPVGSGEWTLSSSLPAQNRLPHQSDTLDDTDEEEADAEGTGDGVEALEQYWGYISGLLKNLESLKAERVHTLLSLFTSPGKENPSLDTVNRFLKKKVSEQLLVFGGGVYKLPK